MNLCVKIEDMIRQDMLILMEYFGQAITQGKSYLETEP